MTNKSKINRQKANRATIVALVINTFLGSTKIVTGLFISSMSLIADGFDSLMDLLMGLFAWFGIILAQKPADRDHLYGHEKIEIIFLIGIVGIIFLTGVGILFQAVDRLLNQIELEFSIIGLIIISISVFGKILIALYVYNTGKQIHSATLKATGVNYATDVISSLLVLIAIISSFFKLGIVDAISATIICGLIIYGALKMFNDGLNILLDRAPDITTLEKLKELSYSIEGVKEVHRVRARIIGEMIIGDMHLLVDPTLNIREGHLITDKVRSLLEEKMKARIIIHLEPYE